MMFWLRLALIVFFASFCGAAIANAAELNKSVTLTSDVLTVGDVFSQAGENADHVLGPAPKAGNVLVLDTKTLKRIATSFNVAWAPVRGTETASVRSDASASKAAATAEGSVKIPVLAEPKSRDDVIQPSDIVWKDVPAKSLRDDTVLKESDIVGQTARGLIQPNEAISANLLVPPKMIKRGDTVTLVLANSRMALSAKGKALSDARLGEIVRVQNTESQKIVQGKVTGPQEATIEPQS